MIWLKWLTIMAVYFATCETIERLLVRADGGNIYRAKFGWRFFWWFCMGSLAAAVVERLLGHTGGNKGFPTWFLIFSLLALVFTWPRTVTVSTSGASSVSLLGTRRRFIPWPEIAAITSDWEEENLFWQLQWIWKFTGTRIIVLGRSGTRIQHTIFLRKQGRFLDDLRLYAPERVFAPGIYDWHPAT